MSGITHAAVAGPLVELTDYQAAHVIPSGSIPTASVVNLSGTNTGDQVISDATITTTDITTNDVSTSKHGFAPKAPNDATKYLDGTGAYSVPPAGGQRPSAYGKAVVATAPTIYLPTQETQKWNVLNATSVGTTPGVLLGTGGSVGNSGGPVTGEALFYTLDGSTNYIQVDIPNAHPFMEFTFMTWLKTSSSAFQLFGTNARIIAIIFGTDGGGAGASGKPRILFDDSGVAFGITGPNTLNDNTWHHLACTWYSNGSTTAVGDFAIYVDGSVVIPNTTNGTGGHTVPPAFGFGVCFGAAGAGGGTKFTGSLAHPAMWLRAISSTEVSTIYAAR